uniref:GDSL esterase/lipase n=1 Tax=Leersia perrieri TaxID=77586 RepID=A0A0D9XBI9_9ORYZ
MSSQHAVVVVAMIVHVMQLGQYVAGGCEGGVAAVMVFGDSTADTGNNNFIQTIARGDYPPYGRDFAGGVSTGRFSNGRLAADFVSEALGLPPAVPPYLDPGHSIHQLASGVSFASAGTGLDNVTAQILSAMTLAQQIDHFRQYKEKLRWAKGEAAAEHIISQALYIFSVGTSDFLQNYLVFPIRSDKFTLPQYEAYLAGAAAKAVRAVHGLGGRRVKFAGLPPLGCLPVERTINHDRPGDCNEMYNMVALSFNARLKRLVRRLNWELPGARVEYVDQYSILSAIIAKPWEYGFENSVQGCCGTGYVETGILCALNDALACDNADKYVFFDAVHPSERTYKIIADAIVNTTSHVFH